MTSRRIRIPLYGGTLVVCASLAEFNRAFVALARRAGVPAEDESESLNAGSSCTSSLLIDGSLHVICYARRNRAHHEATHCAQAVAEHVGMDPLREAEGFAYLAEWMFDQLREGCA